MVKVKFNEQTKQWDTLEPNSHEGVYLDARLKQKLDTIRMIQKQNWDCVFVIDGMEGSGKSTLGKTCAWYLSDTQFNKDHIGTSAKDIISKLGTYKDESVIVIDEGDLAFSSKESMNQEQNRLIKLIKVIRYKKMVLIIIAPTFFDLNRGISVRRSRFLLHVYTDNQLKRGRFAFFGEKKKHMLYEMGKKNFNSYAKPRSDFVGRFVDFEPLGTEYQTVKDNIVKELMEPKKKDINMELVRLRWKFSQIRGKYFRTYKEIADYLNISHDAVQLWAQLPLKYPFLEGGSQKTSDTTEDII